MVPIGGIIQWSGAIVDIPAGFQLCDGTNGTPDLRDKFVVGAGSTYSVDETGGSNDVQHDNDGIIEVAGTGAHAAWNASSSSDIQDNRPPYLALASIQRMS